MNTTPSSSRRSNSSSIPVVMTSDELSGLKPVENAFAAGEIMAGNILSQGYLAGLGMSIGTVFGRIAGEEAARHVCG